MVKNDVRNSIKLTSVDDLFTTEESRAEQQREKVLDIPLSEISDFPNHPFKVKADEAMLEMADSVKQYGVLVPGLVRPKADGGYEMVAGHRRKKASELAGKENMPCIVRELDDDAATIIMVDSNLQRESILPSEKAFAYKMKLEAMNRQGQRTDLTSRQVVGRLESADIIGKDVGESGRQIQRYIRLTELIQPVLEMVDEKQIAFNPAVEISYLAENEQQAGYPYMWLTLDDSSVA
ncbi:MAG: Chromosome-partitioning protein Spo0J [Pelotomaculum sp. PtaB.Bin117]|nr:MAG: Chromosome-partitioning protein Spo0J [Pelotomaculum sp. PtaB.Bin117]